MAGPGEGFGLDPWRFFSLCEKENDRAVKLAAAETALDPSEVKVLLFLANNPSFHTASEVVRWKKMSKAQVSLAVRALTERGYLRQEQGSGKTIRLTVTPAAEEAVRLGREKQMTLLGRMYRGFSPEELELFRSFFLRMEQNLKEDTDN